MKFWILVRPRPQSNRCDAGREEKEAPAAGANTDVSSAARVLKTSAISGIYNARLKQPGNVNSSALMPVLGRKPFKYLSLAVRRRNETHITLLPPLAQSWRAEWAFGRRLSKRNGTGRIRHGAGLTGA
jgi:hypothetical protein